MQEKERENEQKIRSLEKKAAELEILLREKRKGKLEKKKVVNVPGEFFERSRGFGDPF